MATVDIRGLSKSFGSNLVLRNLDLLVRQGEFLTLLGPSGCGKTTTLRCIAGLDRADAGTILIDGQVVAAPAEKVFVPPNRRNIGMVFQSYALWPHMTVFANVAYPLKMRRIGSADRRTQVMALLERVGMAALAHRQVTDLSGGQQQRVALARAMVARPQLLLFDEPLSNLDAKLRQSMRREIRAAHDATGGTSIYVTHDQEEAITLSDRVIVLNHGVVQQIGAPREIYRSPANPFVADFVGFDNLITGHVVQRTDRACAVMMDGSRDPIWAELGEPALVGETASLAVRAEDVRLERRSGSEPSASAGVSGSIRSRTYTGQHVEYLVDIGRHSLMARTQEDSEVFEPNQSVVLTIDPARAVVVAHGPIDESADSAESEVDELEEVR